MTNCTKKHPFAIAFKSCFKEIFAKGQTRSSNFLSRQDMVACPLRKSADGGVPKKWVQIISKP
jgi:hypothetical protein